MEIFSSNFKVVIRAIYVANFFNFFCSLTLILVNSCISFGVFFFDLCVQTVVRLNLFFKFFTLSTNNNKSYIM